MHSTSFVGSIITLFATLSVCQALYIGYTLDVFDSSNGKCKAAAQYLADFMAIKKNIPVPDDGSDIVVRLLSSKCRLVDNAIRALASNGISGMQLWFDYEIPTKQDSTGNVILDEDALLLYIDEVKVAIKHNKACDYLAGINLEHFGHLKSDSIKEALQMLRSGIGLGFQQGPCNGVQITFKTSAYAWLSQYTDVAKEVSQIEFPYNVAPEETDVHALTSSLLNTVDGLKKTFPQSPIVVAGTGWPSTLTSGPSASSTNQQLYWQQFWCKGGDVASKGTVKAVFWDPVIGGADSNSLLDMNGKPKFFLNSC